MYFEASREMTRHNEIRRAVQSMEFELHYQPIVHLNSQRCIGFEALLRWAPAGKQSVSPAMFVPFLEETGLIIRVGEWVIDEACRQLRAWQDRFPDISSIQMAVNLSRIQFNSPRLVEIVVKTLEKYQLSPQRLVAEITETAVAQDPEQTMSKLKELRALGIRVAMDDFGVGYSALGKLDQLPIDILKIDRSFVNRIGSEESEPLVLAILQMTRTLGLPTIAEGVEHYHQAEWLKANGCHEAQGYYYCRPVPAQAGVHPFECINLPGYLPSGRKTEAGPRERLPFPDNLVRPLV
jgi:EAL domain-containing protein (putative c-di-GMP-specific phosphodiesterase class I)